MPMATLNMYLDDDLEARLAREASLLDCTRSDLARAAIEAYLAHSERQRFQTELLRAARARGDREAMAAAAEALYTDNESFGLTREEMSAVEKSFRVVAGLP